MSKRASLVFGIAAALSTSGCGHVANHLLHVGTAVGAGLEVASIALLGGVLGAGVTISTPSTTITADAEVTIGGEATPVAAPPSLYQTWIVNKGRCNSGRQFQLRCVKNQNSGQACFFETDDGLPFDCADADCKRVPDGVNEWCAQAAPPLAPTTPK